MGQILLAGREDGIGARLSCFVAASMIAQQKQLELRFYWNPDHGSWIKHGVEGSILDIFPDYASVVRIGSIQSDSDFGNSEVFDKWFVPHMLKDLRIHYRSMKLADSIREAETSLGNFDYSIHARLGDVQKAPLFWGSSKLFPLQGYLKVIEKIADIHGSSAKVFLASNDDFLLSSAKQILPNLVTEADLLAATEMADAKRIVQLWLIVSQLSKANVLISPPKSAFSTLAQIIGRNDVHQTYPETFLGIEEIYNEINLTWGRHAIDLVSTCNRENAAKIINRINLSLRQAVPLLEANDYKLIAAMKPKPSPFELVRIGGEKDGAYLLPNDLVGVKACFSPGVSNRKSFEDELVKKYGISCHMCDYSSDVNSFKTPLIPGQTFKKKWLDVAGQNDSVTLLDWVADLAPNPSDDLILQMDIEGAEYRNLLNTPEEIICRFRIIVIELHHLNVCINHEEFGKELGPLLALLDKYFACIHAHPNNVSNDFIIPGTDMNMPNYLELTWLRKDRYSDFLDEECYAPMLPHPLDISFNSARKPPLFLNEAWLDGGQRPYASTIKMLTEQRDHFIRSLNIAEAFKRDRPIPESRLRQDIVSGDRIEIVRTAPQDTPITIRISDTVVEGPAYSNAGTQQSDIHSKTMKKMSTPPATSGKRTVTATAKGSAESRSFVAACKHSGVGLSLPRISLKNRYVYFPIPKVANSTLKWLLYNFETNGRLTATSRAFREQHASILVHDPYFGPLLLPSYVEERSQIDYDLMTSDFLRFAFVRNPYSRILSAYLDRAQQKNSNLAKSIAKATGIIGFTFLQMLEAVAAVPDSEREIHVKQQTTLLGIADIPISHIAQFENFTAECVLIFKKIWPNLSEDKILAGVAQTMMSPARTNASSSLSEYVGPVESALIYEIYKEDFEMFGYKQEMIA